MDCEKKSAKINRVGALRGGLEKKCKIKRVGAVRGEWRVDCEKKAQNYEGWGIKGRVEGGL